MTRRPTSPTSPRRPGAPRRAAALASLTALVTALVALGGAAPPAVAHDALSGSTPADGATVETPPASVDLTFSEPPLAIGAEVRVTGPDGGVVNAGDVVLSGTTVRQPLAAELPAGVYAVVWRVTSSDGHPISGELSFTATTGTAGAPTAPEPAPTSSDPAEPTTEPGEDATTEPSPEDTTAAEPPVVSPGDDVEDPSAAGDAERGRGALPWVLGGAALVLAAAGAWWAVRRRPGAEG